MAILWAMAPLCLAQRGTMSMTIFDVDSAFAADFSSRDIAVLIRVLKLNADEEAAVRALYDGYVTALHAKGEAIRAQIADVVERAEAIGDSSLMENSREQQEAFARDAAAMKKGFLDDLHALFSREQESRWPIVEREIARMKQIGNGRLFGESIDLVNMIERVVPEAAKDPQVLEQIEAYAVAMQKALAAREEYLAANGDEFQSKVQSDPAAAERLWKDGFRLRAAVRDLNTKYVAAIKALLTPEQADKLDTAFFDASYSRLLSPGRGEAYLREAAKLDDLSVKQKAVIDEIVKAYEPRRRELLKRMAVIETQYEADDMPRELAVKLGKVQGPDAGNWWNGKLYLPQDHALRRIRQERYELDSSAKKQVKAILTAEQRTKMEAQEPPYARFEDWSPWGL